MSDFLQPAEGTTIRLDTPEELATPVRLPLRLVRKTLKDMKIGDSTWEVPWAMWVSPSGACWISGDFPWDGRSARYDKPHGTAAMLLTRVIGGFKVDLKYCRSDRWGYERKVPGDLDIPVLEISNF